MNFKSTLVLICACCILAGNAVAQKSKKATSSIRLEWGENIELPKKHYPYGFVGNPEAGYVQIGTKGKKEISLVSISPKLNKEGTEVSPFPKSKYIMLENILEVGGHSYLLFSDYDKAANSEKLLVQEINVKTGSLKNSPETIIETKGKVTGNMVSTGFYSFSVTDKFKIVLPDTGNKLLIYYRLKPEEKNNKLNVDKLVYHVFDFNMKEQWHKEVSLPYVEADVKIKKHAIIENDVFVFAETKSGQTFEKNNKTPAFDQISVFKFTKESKKITEKELSIDKSSYVNNFVVGKGSGNSMLISGYYKPNKKTAVFTGYFTGVLNPASLELENVKKYEFQTDLINSFESARKKRKLEKDIEKGKEIGIPFMVMRDVLKRPDGGWYIVGEQHLVTTQVDMSGKQIRYIHKFYYLDAIVASVSSDGEQEWVTKLPKNQMVRFTSYSPAPPSEEFINNMFGSGIASFQYDNNLYVFHLDNIKNKGIGEETVPVPYTAIKGGYLTGIKVTSDGEKLYNDLYDLKEEEYKLVSPTTLTYIGNGKLLSASKRVSIFSKKTNTPALIHLN